jgi:hypothetical protein
MPETSPSGNSTMYMYGSPEFHAKKNAHFSLGEMDADCPFALSYFGTSNIIVA